MYAIFNNKENLFIIKLSHKNIIIFIVEENLTVMQMLNGNVA